MAAMHQRPPLPVEHLNPYVQNLDPSKIPPVKFQEIVRDGQSTVVARMKIQTPTSHAFILRRLDTGAVSSTTMFRAAFPSATDDAERAESTWIKTHWNIGGANKQGSARFAGTWVTQDVAYQLARDYHLFDVIQPLAAAIPDANVVFRKSGKALQQPTPVASPVASVGNLQDTPPVKRRREASPAGTPTRTPAAGQPTPRRGATPQRTAAAVATPRRVTRAATPPPPVSVAKFIKRIEETTPGSDETAVEDDARDQAGVMEQHMEEDIREQKELVSRLKAEAASQKQAALETVKAVAGADSVATVEQVISTETTIVKRAREEEPTEYTLNIKEPAEAEVGERAIATNRRVDFATRPQQKSLAWGALLFAAGVGAMSFIPNLPSFF